MSSASTLCVSYPSADYKVRATFSRMDPKEAIRLSKFLSKHLRHEPGAIGLTLAEGGWVRVAELLAACARHGHPLTLAQLT